MRDIEFRWRGKFSKTWYYWDRSKDPILWRYMNEEESGQFIGLTDLKNNKIFEGDIVKVTPKIPFGSISDIEGVVKFNSQNACYNVVDEFGDLINFNKITKVEIIGNVFDSEEFSLKYRKLYFEK